VLAPDCALMSSVPTIELNEGHAFPQLGFGVFQIDPAETPRAVETALEIGYRHIDPAEMYRNEQDVGDAVRASGLDRDQIELHPYFLNDAVRAYGEAHGIATGAWSPIAQGEVLGDPDITAIAERLGSSPAQVVLRWHLQRGNIVFPKSTTPARIRENLPLFDFELEPADMERIAALDAGEAGRTGANPDVFAFGPPDTART
jgi:diketogulonate reductase-like aldo/keto reductase